MIKVLMVCIVLKIRKVVVALGGLGCSLPSAIMSHMVLQGLDL